MPIAGQIHLTKKARTIISRAKSSTLKKPTNAWLCEGQDENFPARAGLLSVDDDSSVATGGSGRLSPGRSTGMRSAVPPQR